MCYQPGSERKISFLVSMKTKMNKKEKQDEQKETDGSRHN
jgi:hypothetical protein